MNQFSEDNLVERTVMDLNLTKTRDLLIPQLITGRREIK